jgi:hypothetical protein
MPSQSVVRAVFVLAFLWAPSPIRAQSTRLSRLSGITTLTVLVEELPQSAALANVTADRLRTVAELKLRSAGIRVLSQAEDSAALGHSESLPYVYIQLEMLPPENGPFVYHLSVSVRKLLPPRTINGSPIRAVFWEKGTLARVGSARMPNQVADDLSEFLDALVNEILQANPRR